MPAKGLPTGRYVNSFAFSCHGQDMPENSLNIFCTQLRAQTVWILLPFIKLLNTTRTMDFKHLAHAISREFETAREQSSAFVDQDIVWLARMVTKKKMAGLYPDMVGTVEDGEFLPNSI